MKGLQLHHSIGLKYHKQYRSNDQLFSHYLTLKTVIHSQY